MKHFKLFSFLTIVLFFSSCEKDDDFGDDPYNPGVETEADPQLEFGERLLELVNDVRAAGCNCGQYGFQPAVDPILNLNQKLNQAAKNHGQDMWVNDFFSHTSSNGGDLVDRLNEVGYLYSSAGENIANICSSSPSDGYSELDVFNAWLSSDGHCKNMMKSQFTEMGIAKVGATGGGGCEYWVQVFGKPQ